MRFLLASIALVAVQSIALGQQACPTYPTQATAAVVASAPPVAASIQSSVAVGRPHVFGHIAQRVRDRRALKTCLVK